MGILVSHLHQIMIIFWTEDHNKEKLTTHIHVGSIISKICDPKHKNKECEDQAPILAEVIASVDESFVNGGGGRCD